MTQSFAVDANNDLFIGADDKLTMATGIDAVKFACEHAAKTILAEMVLATDEGLPYFEAVWTGAPNLPQYEVALRDALLAVDGVEEVVTLTIGQTADEVTYTAAILTIYGATTVNG
jgi:hypothetical protein